MKKVIYILERLIEGLGRGVSLLSLLLALIIGVDVAMRYLFNFTKIWVIELETYCFTFLFLWGSAYAFKKDRHVRVDVFYQRLNDKGRAWINLIGAIFLLLPWCIVVIKVSWPYLYMSYMIGESSAQAGGLANLFLLKGSIFTGFSFLLFQGLLDIVRSAQTLLQPGQQKEPSS